MTNPAAPTNGVIFPEKMISLFLLIVFTSHLEFTNVSKLTSIEQTLT